MDMINGKMTAAQQHAIDDAKPGQKLLLAGRLATSAHGAPFTEMKLMKRKFRGRCLRAQPLSERATASAGVPTVSLLP